MILRLPPYEAARSAAPSSREREGASGLKHVLRTFNYGQAFHSGWSARPSLALVNDPSYPTLLYHALQSRYIPLNECSESNALVSMFEQRTPEALQNASYHGQQQFLPSQQPSPHNLQAWRKPTISGIRTLHG
ncbi:hypothetical protein LshimejAT787_1801080 [Lyophyllum shimeji]|uniref:Uncharacterized protein n=1 Tax=Lyophyllum shimeji TaxID=47721 RepID=A0A9P3UW48_LYOSH|nr:hypothetical protein LshimejAT787_1801080 [Lyophyllum shimeji]